MKQVCTLPFVTAALLLGLTAFAAGPLADWLNIRDDKEALPLRRPLGSLDEQVLYPFQVRDRAVLAPEIVDAMGTDQYLSWTLEDPTVPSDDPLRFAHLFVTYYTGGHKLVPHRPDLCYLGAGYEPHQAHENLEIGIRSLGQSIPIRVCTFVKTALQNRDKESVVYTFHANGRFESSAYGVRRLTNGLTNRYAFFSKVEVQFPRATREQCVEGAKKIYDLVLPALVEQHWPDFEAAERAAR